MKVMEIFKESKFMKVICSIVAIVAILGLLIPYIMYRNLRKENLGAYEKGAKNYYEVYTNVIYPNIDKLTYEDILNEFYHSEYGLHHYYEQNRILELPYSWDEIELSNYTVLDTRRYINERLLSKFKSYLGKNHTEEGDPMYWYGYGADTSEEVFMLLHNRNKDIYNKLTNLKKEGKSYYEIMTLPYKELEELEELN
ncbi:hypothetical protein [Tissierella praeacuta]|uniref:hypothetical protein n=1 Tax=Tissierella praeacuta TaxID=43131 RepID=UPI00289F232C|nr:hypothetical protein [Tissierella praeacuta]